LEWRPPFYGQYQICKDNHCIFLECHLLFHALELYPTFRIRTLPRKSILASVGEVEMCVTYINPLLEPLISDPDQNVLLRW
jgi:hypothetical protein